MAKIVMPCRAFVRLGNNNVFNKEAPDPVDSTSIPLAYTPWMDLATPSGTFFPVHLMMMAET
jgi:hypothetical protein